MQMALSRIAQVGRKSVVVGRRHRLGRSACETELIRNSISRMQMQICLKSLFFFAKCSKTTLDLHQRQRDLSGWRLRSQVLLRRKGERKQSQTILAAARVSLSLRTLWLNPALLYSSFLSSFLPSFFLPITFSKAACRRALPSAESRLTVSKFLLSRLLAFYL